MTPWARRCPEGHCSWRPAGDRIYCECCEEYYPETVDAREVDEFPAESKQLVTDGGHDEQRWDHEWHNYRDDDGRGAIHRSLLNKRAGQQLARRRGISRRQAAQLIANGEVDPEDVVDGWCPHGRRVRGGSHV